MIFGLTPFNENKLKKEVEYFRPWRNSMKAPIVKNVNEKN